MAFALLMPLCSSCHADDDGDDDNEDDDDDGDYDDDDGWEDDVLGLLRKLLV